MYSCYTELIEIELTICIKMDLALNKQQRLMCHKTQPTNQPTNQMKSEISKITSSGIQCFYLMAFQPFELFNAKNIPVEE